MMNRRIIKDQQRRFLHTAAIGINAFDRDLSINRAFKMND
jgi:hypothetical protein